MTSAKVARFIEVLHTEPHLLAGKSYPTIAKEFGISRDTVGRFVRKCGTYAGGFCQPGARHSDKQSKAADDAIIYGELERDDEYFAVITRNKSFGVSLTGEYWKRYRLILAWKIKHGERAEPPNWSKIFGFKTT